MLLSGIGSIRNTLKMNELNMKWQQRKENPNLKNKQNEDPEIKRFRETAEKMRKSNIMASIDGKLKAGGNLSSEEMDYLKANNPQLYQEAVKIKEERQAYKRQLQACKTKEDVEKLKQNKLQSFLSEAKVVEKNPNIPEGKKLEKMNEILRRVMGIQSEHLKFVKSKEYEDLPREEEIKAKEKQKKRKIHTEEDENTKKLDIDFDSLKAELSSLKDQYTEDEETVEATPSDGAVTYNASGNIHTSDVAEPQIQTSQFSKKV